MVSVHHGPSELTSTCDESSPPVLPHSWHLDPCKTTSPTRPIKVATRTRQDDARPTGKDRVLLSRGSEVRVLPGAPSGAPGRTGESRAQRGRTVRPGGASWRGWGDLKGHAGASRRVQTGPEAWFRLWTGPKASPRTGRAAGRQKRRSKGKANLSKLTPAPTERHLLHEVRRKA